MSKKKILITGAGSGLGEGTAIGLAQEGHDVIAGVQIWPQVTELRKKAEALGLKNLRAEKLNLHHPYDVQNALNWDIDILVNNAAIGENGPISEIPIELVRSTFETNIFAALDLTQKFIRKFIDERKGGKIIFTSSMGGLFSPAGFGPYCATKHAIESIAETLQGELRRFNIQVQTINPGAYLTGFNETMAETAFHWMDDRKNLFKREEIQNLYNELLGNEEGRRDPKEMIDAMVKIIPSDTGNFRNVVPKAVEDLLKKRQTDAWSNRIDLPNKKTEKAA
jgi:NAD(P)-dependent dehydrogenase (short-subunit alcohol dehydrogenase family)